MPVRIDARDPVSLARAASFVAQTPARIVVVPMWTASADQWATFGMAIKALPDLLFIVAAGDEGRDIDREPVWPAAFGHGNLLVVSAAPAEGVAQVTTRPNTGPKTVAAIVDGAENSRMAAVLAADVLAGCWPHLPQRAKGEALKAALLAEVAKQRPGSTTPVIERCGVKRPARAENPVIPGRCTRNWAAPSNPVRVCPPRSGQARPKVHIIVNDSLIRRAGSSRWGQWFRVRRIAGGPI